jgi:hypothetical protein
MTQPDSTSAEKSSSTSKKPARNPVERAIVWGLIAIAGGVAAWEYRAKSGYDSSLEYIQKRVNAVNGAGDTENQPALKVGEVKEHLSGGPTVSEMTKSAQGDKLVNLKWPSLFKKYELVLVVNNNTDNAVVYNVRPAVDEGAD